MSKTKEDIFEKYHEVHGQFLDAVGLASFQKQVNKMCDLNYKGNFLSGGRVLEIGCGKGYVLHWIKERGNYKIDGIDLSSKDVEFAKEYVGLESIFCANAFDFLNGKENIYDVIIAKAVMEHIEKDMIGEFLSRVRTTLKPGGKIIIHVPNMDWIMAGHERSMDFTHEMGFTRESLAQVLRLYFENVSVYPGKIASSGGPVSIIRAFVLRPLAVAIFRMFLYSLGEGAHGCWFEYRSILGVGTKEVKQG